MGGDAVTPTASLPSSCTIYPMLHMAVPQAFIGNRFFAMHGLDRSAYVTWFFQFTFAATGE